MMGQTCNSYFAGTSSKSKWTRVGGLRLGIGLANCCRQYLPCSCHSTHPHPYPATTLFGLPPVSCIKVLGAPPEAAVAWLSPLTVCGGGQTVLHGVVHFAMAVECTVPPEHTFWQFSRNIEFGYKVAIIRTFPGRTSH